MGTEESSDREQVTRGNNFQVKMAFKLGTRSLLEGCSRPRPVVKCSIIPQMMKQNLPTLTHLARPMSEFSPSISESSLPASIFQPSLVIFDKDGTLVCFHTMWNSWCEELAKRMSAETDKDMAGDVYELMGYDSDTKKIRMGILAEKTHPYIKEKVVEMLIKQGFSEWEAKNVLKNTWKDTPENMQIKMTGNLKSLFSRLKAKNIKIAICTSDSREGTVEFLERLSLSYLVDIVVCGDDEVSVAKPDPNNAIHICKELNIDLSEAIMVGDTPADTIMGQAANLGLTIGVLTGVGTNEALTHADVIVNDVSEVVDLISPNADSKDFHSVTVTARGINKIAQRSSFLQSNNNHTVRSTALHTAAGGRSEC